MEWQKLKPMGVMVGEGDYDIKIMTSTGATVIIRNVFYLGNKWLNNYTEENVLCDGDIVISYRKTSK